MNKYRIVAEVLTPTDYPAEFEEERRVLWQGDHHPMGSIPELPTPEPPAELGATYLQRQRFMHLGWKTVHASVERI
jgi:hypothetical protein